MGGVEGGLGGWLELPNQQQGKEMPSAKRGDNSKAPGKGHEHNLLAAATAAVAMEKFIFLARWFFFRFASAIFTQR